MVAANAAGPTLTIWIYDSALGAAAGEVRLRKLQERTALQVHDEVTVTWMPGAHQPRMGTCGTKPRRRPPVARYWVDWSA